MGWVIAGLVLAIFLACSIRVCQIHERFAILRLGKYLGVRGPGIFLTVPLIDRAIRVDPSKVDAAWGQLPPELLAEKIGRYLFAPGTSWESKENRS